MTLTTRVATGGASTYAVTLRDHDHGGLEATFTYGGAAEGWTLTEMRVGLLGPTNAKGGLRASSLRDLPLVRWQRAAREALVESARQDVVGWFEDQDKAAKALGIEKLRWGDVRGDPSLMRRLTQTKRLAYIARLYRRSVAEGRRDPAAAVAREVELNPSTVRSLIYRARKAGFLEPPRTLSSDDTE